MRKLQSSVASMADDLVCAAEWQIIRVSTLEEMPLAIDSVLAELAPLEYSPKVALGARLALEEAICNAIKHGNQSDASKLVELRYRFHAQQLFIEVEDEGPGFDPDDVADATAPENLDRPCGRGLLLIRHYAQGVRHNRKGNCVAFYICPAKSDA